MKQGKCICPLVHCNLTGDGKCCGRGWACTQPSPAWPNFTLIIECTPKSDCCYSVYSVVCTINVQLPADNEVPYLWVGCGCVEVGPVTGGRHVAARRARVVRLERGIRTKADHKAVATATQHVVDLRLGKVHPMHLHDSQSGCLSKNHNFS
jgi:hypothetical protein